MRKKQQAVFKSKSPAFSGLPFPIPKTHIAAVAGLIVSLLVLFGFNSFEDSKPLPINQFASLELQIPKEPLKSLANEETQPALSWKNVTVKQGQTLSSIFDSLDLSQSTLLKIVNTDENSKKLTKIYPGAEINFGFDESNQFKQLSYKLSALEELVIESRDAGFESKIIEHPTETQVETANGVITGSLFVAGKNAGLTDSMVMKLANVFAWDIDFVLDIRQGDHFSLIYEKIYQNGEFIKDGNIVAASFTNQGKTYKAVAFDDGDGISFYNPEGRNMKKAFLRAPLNFSYISSNFNPRRFHPVQKRIKPHRGIDYAAPRGTPVYAAGNGKVIKSGYDKYNGNYVFIQHNNNIVTKYLHFTKRMVKKGQRVKQGQTIGTVGSTGMVTGVHLHYEFLLNGVHRNPRTVALPKASPLAKNKIDDFKLYATPLFSQLDSIDLNFLAKNESQSSNNNL